MKIALIIERMDPSRGGRETSTAQIAAGLARRGHEVTILCQDSSLHPENVEIVALGRRGLTRTARMANFAAAVDGALVERKFDIAHAMLPVPGANVYQPRGGTFPAQRAASRRRRGTIGGFLAAMFEPLNSSRRQMCQWERYLVDDPGVLCLAVSEMVAGEFETYYGRTTGVRVIYNGADVPDVQSEQRADWRQEIRFRMGLRTGDVVFLVVAENFALKGVTETIIAFARWVHRRRYRGEVRLVIVGRQSPEGYQRLAKMREVGMMVVFVPHSDEIFRWYAAADACVLLSWYDPCSRVVLEAMRWGIPSITTVYNGAAEVLADGAGIVVSSPKDTKAVIAAMEELADPAARAARTQACLKAADQVSMDRHVDELLSAYAEVAQASRPSGTSRL